MNKIVWDNTDSSLPLVVENSSWRFIKDFSGFQSCNGIFIFTNAAHQVMYIGISENNCIVEAIADAIGNKFDENSAIVKVLYTQTEKDAKLIRNVLIEKYKPANNSNKHSVKAEPIITGTNRVF